ncbi:hypothetical protein J7E69_17405, partial [Rhodococcus enclensis]|nr:hypothetical protein [Rhodococcus qingshengii]
SIRDNLTNGWPIDLTLAPVTWVQRWNGQTFTDSCYALAISIEVGITGRVDPVRPQSRERRGRALRVTKDEVLAQSLDLMVPAPDPTAQSILHIDPEGPHTLTNCRLAQLFCNNDAQVTKGFDAELA